MTGRCRYTHEGYECSLQEHHGGLHVASTDKGAIIWHDRQCRSEDEFAGRCTLELDHEGLHQGRGSYGIVSWEE